MEHFYFTTDRKHLTIPDEWTIYINLFEKSEDFFEAEKPEEPVGFCLELED